MSELSHKCFIDLIPQKKLNGAEFRTWIESVQRGFDKVECAMDRHECLSHGYKLEEAMTPGIYTRELTMPAGSIVISKIHLTEHPFLITKGLVSVYDGEEVVTLKAPHKGVTKKGTKRILYNHEETTWITFHPAPSDDLEEMDKNGVITCETFEEFEEIQEGLCLL